MDEEEKRNPKENSPKCNIYGRGGVEFQTSTCDIQRFKDLWKKKKGTKMTYVFASTILRIPLLGSQHSFQLLFEFIAIISGNSTEETGSIGVDSSITMAAAPENRSPYFWL